MKTRTPKKNKSDLLKSFLQYENDLTPQINEAIFNRFFDLLEKSLSQNLSIELRNFGIFKSKKMPSRYGSNPKNKEKIYIPSKWKVAFKLSEYLNKKLNEEI
ncbi:HU family DNA-binding protein [Alphaproteobacteria bacterium]|nr:HU family DNA-binding protein [Alphaproteobacteria bacterium]